MNSEELGELLQDIAANTERSAIALETIAEAARIVVKGATEQVARI